MVIREARMEDYNQMNTIFKQVDNQHSNAHPEIFKQLETPARSKEYIQHVLDDEKQKLIVAEENNNIIGIAKAEIDCAPTVPLFIEREWLNISTIVVDNHHQGKGIGKELLGYLYLWAKQHNIDEVELTVFSFNQNAIKFYEKNGFTEVRKKMRTKIN